MRKYLNHTKQLAEATPSSRNRVVDFWRATAITVVIFGHWLAASIWIDSDGSGEIELMNSLQWIPFAGWVTWVVQVMPIFFLAGGYANARALDAAADNGLPLRKWISARARRLLTPVPPLVLVWTALIVATSPFLSPDIVRAGAMNATLPLWFLAVYLGLTVLAPLTYAWWRRSGAASLAVLIAAAVAVDAIRFLLDIEGIGWINFALVWGAVHQIGYLWARTDIASGVSTRSGKVLAVASLALLIGLTGTGLYPVAMVGIPGAAVTNMTPPTTAMLILGLMQLGIIWSTQPMVRRLTADGRVWHIVVATSGVIMTLYLWHLSAMSLVAVGGLNLFDGALFRIEPASAAWWISRPLWLLLLSITTAGLVVVFARFEWQINQRRPHPVSLGIGLIPMNVAVAQIALDGLATRAGGVVWTIPASVIIGTIAVGAYPIRRRRMTPAPHRMTT